MRLVAIPNDMLELLKATTQSIQRGNYLLNYLPEEEAERMEAIRQGLISSDEADADKRRR